MEPVPDDQATHGAAPEPEDASTRSGPSLPPPTGLESLVNALLEAGPDVAEHVVRAAHELLLAAQAVVDAAERAVEEQREVHTQPEDLAPGASATVHPIDRNE